MTEEDRIRMFPSRAERLPQNTDDVKYVLSSWEEEISLYDLMWQAEEYFPDTDPVNIRISHQEIQFRCFGYDLYDSSDYRWYWVFERRV